MLQNFYTYKFWQALLLGVISLPTLVSQVKERLAIYRNLNELEVMLGHF